MAASLRQQLRGLHWILAGMASLGACATDEVPGAPLRLTFRPDKTAQMAFGAELVKALLGNKNA